MYLYDLIEPNYVGSTFALPYTRNSSLISTGCLLHARSGEREREKGEMGLLTNKVERSEIKAGDHIYTYRAVFTYSHHGISIFCFLCFYFD